MHLDMKGPYVVIVFLFLGFDIIVVVPNITLITH